MKSRILTALKKRMPSLPLAYRLTGYFVIFGIVVGYFSFIAVMTITSRHFIKTGGDFARSVVREYADRYEEGTLVQIIRENPALLQEVMSILESRSPGLSGFITLYRQERGNEEWRRIDLGPLDDDFSMEMMTPEDTLLAKALDRKVAAPAPVFWGKSDVLHIAVDVTQQGDDGHHVLLLGTYREGLAKNLQRNLHSFLAFDAILFIFSLILGKFFARRITLPVEQLSAEARRRAAGVVSGEFPVPDRSDEIGSLAVSMKHMTETIQTQVQEAQRRLLSMETMNRIDKAVLSAISRAELLERVVDIVRSYLGSAVVALVLRDDTSNIYELHTMKGDSVTGMITEKPSLPVPVVHARLGAFLEDGGVRNSSDIELPFPDEMRIEGMEKVYSFPIFIHEHHAGSLLVFQKEGQVIEEGEEHTLRMLADQVGVSMENVRNFEAQQNLLLGTLMALTRAIDAKSPWTAGHSERVAHYAEEMGSVLGYDSGRLQELSMSAILHDIGKIGVPEEILNKPSRLTAEEYDVIQSHPLRGYEILKGIPSYDGILPGILHHHEKWNGHGYPEGLKEKEIPLNARIIALCDVYDAVTADRPYRKGMSNGDAERLLREEKGQAFDPELVDIFISKVMS